MQTPASGEAVARTGNDCIMATLSTRFGRYDLLRPIGKGGMAEVFLARYAGPEGFEKLLVIKRVLPKIGESPHLLRMFFEEAKTQVSLSHGNLVSVFDFGRVDNDYFIAMDYVRGADLASLFAADRAAGQRLAPSAAGPRGRRDLPRPRLRAWARLRSSRRDPEERAAVGRRRGEAVRLRPRARRAEPDRARAAGHAQLHVARAGARRSRRWARGSVLARPDPRGGTARAGPAGQLPTARGASTRGSSPMSRHAARWAGSWPARSPRHPNSASPGRPRCSPPSSWRSAASARRGRRSSASSRARSTRSRPTRKRLRPRSPRAATAATAVDAEPTRESYFRDNQSAAFVDSMLAPSQSRGAGARASLGRGPRGRRGGDRRGRARAAWRAGRRRRVRPGGVQRGHRARGDAVACAAAGGAGDRGAHAAGGGVAGRRRADATARSPRARAVAVAIAVCIAGAPRPAPDPVHAVVRSIRRRQAGGTGRAQLRRPPRAGKAQGGGASPRRSAPAAARRHAGPGRIGALRVRRRRPLIEKARRDRARRLRKFRTVRSVRTPAACARVGKAR